MKSIILTVVAAFMAVVSFAAEEAAKVKKVLVFSRCEGYNHKESIAVCKENHPP
jgi:hypothetical protein